MPPLTKVLVANRGEIAVRVLRAAHELGLATVAVCSEADVSAHHTQYADECLVIGPAQASKSYLDVDAVIGAAKESGADAIHPGYGLLSERASFAERVVSEGLIYVGPSAEAIRLMGDKVAARKTARAAGVPTVPGSDGAITDVDDGIAVAERIGFPIALKAAAGGGGRGIRIITSADELASGFKAAQDEAREQFGSEEVYLERFVEQARHIEVQVFGDGERFVHLGERECSMQRRRQKLLEESPAPGLPEASRTSMAQAAVQLAASVEYESAGTVEFLYDPAEDEFYFIEMNTRIQVEHPVTEMVTGRDLIREQLLVAGGAPLSFTQEEVAFSGHAVEFRLNAEDPDLGFLPSPGHIDRLWLPGGPFVRIDSGYRSGDDVSPFYDSLLAKIIVWGPDRDQALGRAARALDEVAIDGVKTTAPLLREIVDLPAFRDGHYDTTFLERWIANERDNAEEPTRRTT
jgi:acetyl-CoA carboxylase, biotin carboxylase subunit